MFKYSTVILVLFVHVFGPWETSYCHSGNNRDTGLLVRERDVSVLWTKTVDSWSFIIFLGVNSGFSDHRLSRRFLKPWRFDSLRDIWLFFLGSRKKKEQRFERRKLLGDDDQMKLDLYNLILQQVLLQTKHDLNRAGGQNLHVQVLISTKIYRLDSRF